MTMAGIEDDKSVNKGEKRTQSATIHSKAAQESISLDHRRLAQNFPESIRIFIHWYDQYENEVVAHAKKRQGLASAAPAI